MVDAAVRVEWQDRRFFGIVEGFLAPMGEKDNVGLSASVLSV